MQTKLPRRSFLIASASLAFAGSPLILKAGDSSQVQSLKTPDGGLQPQAVVDRKGVTHLIYLYGDPSAADIGYVRKGPNDKAFSSPIRVNDKPGSAIAIGTVRGAHLVLGKADRVHVAWNGSTAAEPKGPHGSAPMLYTRMNDANTGFEPQRSVMTTASGLDGGGALAADGRGNVYVAWHAQGQRDGKPLEGEGYRRVWLARSVDDGKTFAAEVAVSPAEVGACGCCGMGAVTDESGNLYLLYRSARQVVHRDMYLLVSRDKGKTFQPTDVHPWEIGACPMSTVSLFSHAGRVLMAWETDKQIYFAAINSRTGDIGKPIGVPGEGKNRKHPVITVNQNGQTLLAWTEGTGWKRGGSLAWQVFDTAGKVVGGPGGSPNLPAWDFAAAVPAGNSFVVIS